MAETYPVPERVAAGSNSPMADMEAWKQMVDEAAADPDAFWLSLAQQRVHWHKAPTKGLEGDFHQVVDKPLRWFSDGQLNVTETCIDQHLPSRGDKIAILWEGDEPGTNRTLTYRELHREVSRATHALQQLGVEKGDRVIIYMGMVPEAAIAMLACARLGAVHSVVFGGFSAEALRDRILDCDARVVITQDQGRRGGKIIPLKAVMDEALAQTPDVRKSLVYRHTGADVSWVEGRDVWWQDALEGATEDVPAVVCDAEDPLFVLYTSGSTGKPKGLVHTCGGYIAHAAFSTDVVFDLREDDIYACVADVGWITGHTYIVYGPLANGATTLMFESIPTYPDAGRYWDLVERHKITVFYTAPTALRALAAFGDEFVKGYDRSSLRVLGTVGEPINPAAWHWYYNVVGEGRCTVVDTWWQTETGGIMISPLAPATPTKPGSATLPLPGVLPALVDEEGKEIEGAGQGRLCITHPWPSIARTVWGDHGRYVDTYFAMYRGYYFTGDGCKRDEDGYYWITGRVDDVINVSGHRMGTAEFESVLVGEPKVAEAAVVPFPHDIKGQGVYAYVVLQDGEADLPELEPEMQQAVRRAIGAHARMDHIQVVPGLPKTRSGKVMRRILRKIAEGQPEALGDVSTLADPGVVDAIIQGAKR